ITAHAFKPGSIVVGIVPDGLINFLGMVGDNQQCLLLIALIEHVEDLGAGKLEDNRVQGLIPAKEQAGHNEHSHISQENIVPGVDALALGEENGDKIRTAAGGVGKQAEADGTAIDNAAENADEQRVGSNFKSRQQVGEDTAH